MTGGRPYSRAFCTRFSSTCRTAVDRKQARVGRTRLKTQTLIARVDRKRLAHDLIERRARGCFAIARTGVMQELADHPVHLLDVGDDLTRERRIVLVEEFDRDAQSGERRAQIVRDAAQHELALLIELGEPMRHGLERNGKRAHFARSRRSLDLHSLALRKPRGRRRELRERRGQPARRQRGGAQRQHRRRAPDDERRRRGAGTCDAPGQHQPGIPQARACAPRSRTVPHTVGCARRMSPDWLRALLRTRSM